MPLSAFSAEVCIRLLLAPDSLTLGRWLYAVAAVGIVFHTRAFHTRDPGGLVCCEVDTSPVRRSARKREDVREMKDERQPDALAAP